jgi:NAD+--dinitrogen-reductase ADP-D-ribosyltransferase
MATASDDSDAAWRRGNGTNLIGIPSGYFASTAFNEHPAPVRIAGVREMHPDLFHLLLDGVQDLDEAAAAFTAYMAAVFGLNDQGRSETKPDKAGRRRYRASYLRLLRGWAYDSNSPEGAVLKGWVESRFGLTPTFHREPLRRYASPAWVQYVEQKMGSRFHSNAIFGQLDLLYEFAQWALVRFQPADSHQRLFRGVNDFDEHPILERIDRRRVVVRLNNVVSFTVAREIAGCFGDCVLEADVPAAKILFFSSLLPRHALKGEGEVLVIGGDYRVTAGYW